MEYILSNFILYVRRNLKNVTIELAIQSHSAPMWRISIAREKKSYIYVKNLNTWQLCGFFWLAFCLKHISYFHNILWLGTDAATSFLPLYLLLSPSRNYLFCNHHPPWGRGSIWVVLLHHYIHTYKIICFFNT